MSTPARLAALVALSLACLLGPTACGPLSSGDQEASWSPPTAAEERVDRIREKANAGDGPEARAPGALPVG